jgi:hypothetical protein
VVWVDFREEAPCALFAQPRRHRSGRFAGIPTALVSRADDPCDLTDDCFAVDGDRGLRGSDRLAAATVAQDPVQPPLVPIVRPTRDLPLIAVSQLFERAG